MFIRRGLSENRFPFKIKEFDTSDIIKGEKNLSIKFFDEILTTEHRLEIHADLEVQIKKILSIDSIDYRTKLTALNSIFSAECKKRSIPVHSLAFDNEKKLVRIEVPFSPTDISIEDEIIDKALNLFDMELLLYCCTNSITKTL